MRRNEVPTTPLPWSSCRCRRWRTRRGGVGRRRKSTAGAAARRRPPRVCGPRAAGRDWKSTWPTRAGSTRCRPNCGRRCPAAAWSTCSRPRPSSASSKPSRPTPPSGGGRGVAPRRASAAGGNGVRSASCQASAVPCVGRRPALAVLALYSSQAELIRLLMAQSPALVAAARDGGGRHARRLPPPRMFRGPGQPDAEPQPPRGAVRRRSPICRRP